MRKALVILITLGLSSLAAATTAAPGEPAVLDDNITENGTESPEIVSSQLPSNINLSVQDGNLTASPSYDLYPDNYSGDVEFSNGYNQSYTVEVPEVFNWSAQPEELNGTISVGSSGQINTTEIDLRSNVDPEFNGEITGNISEYFSVDRFQFEEAGKYTVLLGYGVNENTQFGNYTGQLVIEGNQGTNQTVNLSYVFEDNIPPRITDTDIADVMSTKQADWSLVTSDNLGVSQACAEIWREVEVEKENKTVMQNQTLENSPYCFEQESNTNLFRLAFDETEEEETQHYLNITVNDSSDNTVHSFHSFNVEGLDSLQVQRTDFRYEAIFPSSQAEKSIFQVDKATPVEVSLTSFQYEGNNTVRPGILKEGDQNPVYFDDNGGEITVEDAGGYKLVVDSSSDQDVEVEKEFDGVLDLSTVPQHVEHPTEIRFSGLIYPGDTPEPSNATIGNFEGFVGYSIPERFIERYSGNATGRIVYVGTIDREECVGISIWKKCTGFTFGEMQEVKEENSDLRSKNTSLFWQRNIAVIFSMVFIIGYVRSKNLVGKHVAVIPVRE